MFPHKGNIIQVLELCVTDLERVIQDKKVMISPSDVKSFTKMMLEGLAHCHKNWILHRDMKPNNLFIGVDHQLKIADFGLARTYGSPGRVMTSQVLTLWYRPPELLFGATEYSGAVDMWAVGCIIAEMILRRAFLPGKSDLDQGSKIVEVLGTPNEEQWPGMTSLPTYVPYTEVPKCPFDQIFTASDALTIDLLERIIVWDPTKRLTAEEALQHPYFAADPPPTAPADLPGVVVEGGGAGGEEGLESKGGEKGGEGGGPGQEVLDSEMASCRQALSF